jgi:NADH-quinone oxidoreductase subunit J
MTVAASIIGAGLLASGICMLLNRGVLPHEAKGVAIPTFQAYAAQLFTTYLLPVQVVGFLLLIAMLGVIVLSKKFATTEGAS